MYLSSWIWLPVLEQIRAKSSNNDAVMKFFLNSVKKYQKILTVEFVPNLGGCGGEIRAVVP